MIEFHQPQLGYRIHYHPGEVTHCPSCAKTQWIVGRLTAQCAFCATAVPISAAGMTGVGLFLAQAREPRRLPIAA